MKKLRLLKPNEIAVRREGSIYCDFCGDVDKEVFSSCYDEHADESKNETQICSDCIKQLSKFV